MPTFRVVFEVERVYREYVLDSIDAADIEHAKLVAADLARDGSFNEADVIERYPTGEVVGVFVDEVDPE